MERIHNDAKQNFKSNRVGFSQKVFGSVYCQKTKDFCQAGNFTFFKVFVLYSLIAIRRNYNSDMLATIWHEIVDIWKFTKIWKDFQHRNTELFLSWMICKQFHVPNMQEQSKRGKKKKSKDKHLSFDGLIQENIDLSDTGCIILKWTKLNGSEG